MARGAVADRKAARDEIVLGNFSNFGNVESAKMLHLNVNYDQSASRLHNLLDPSVPQEHKLLFKDHLFLFQLEIQGCFSFSNHQ